MTGIGCGERGRVGFGYNPCGFISSSVIVTSCLTCMSPCIEQSGWMKFKGNDGSTSSLPDRGLLPSSPCIVTVGDVLRAESIDVSPISSPASIVDDIMWVGIGSILVD